MTEQELKRIDEIVKGLVIEDNPEKLAVFPYGEVGKIVAEELNNNGKKISLIVDNGSANTDFGIIPFCDVEQPDRYIWMVCTSVKMLYFQIKNELLDAGVNEKKIIDVCGIEEEISEVISNRAKLDVIYEDRIKTIKESGRKKIRFGVYLMYASEYAAYDIVEKMLEKPDLWDVKVVIIPDMMKEEAFSKKEYEKAGKFVTDLYGKDMLVEGYDFSTHTAYDHSGSFDIVYCTNCYDQHTDRVHSIEYLAYKTLPIFINYGYDVSNYYNKLRVMGRELNYVWKCFVDTIYSLEDMKKYQLIKGKNVVLSGYAKMDRLNAFKETKHTRKKILITPHHSVKDKNLPLSNFLEYAEYYLELPKRYPEIDFVFRPHQLLFITLVSKGIWDSSMVEQYLASIKAARIEYSTEGDYLNLFRECDAIINDCGSFTIEWMLTGKPGCFIRNKDLKKSQLTQLMNDALDNYYVIANNKNDIDAFIQEVAESEASPSVPEWVKKNVMVNYPNSSDAIIRSLEVFD